MMINKMFYFPFKDSCQIVKVLVAFLILTSCEPKLKYYEAVEMYSTTSLNIREAPGTEYYVLNTVSPNSELLTYDSISNGFIMVLNDDSTFYGWASKKYLNTEPLTERQLARLKAKNRILGSSKSKIKFGLEENIRQEIWQKSIKAEDRAQKEADSKYPMVDVNTIKEESKLNSELYLKLRAKYTNDLASDYRIPVAIIDSIKLEGLRNRWPLPKY